MLKTDASKLLDKPMDRRQFLRNVGVGLVALTGLTAAIRAIGQTNILDNSDTTSNQSTATTYGYGGSVYGGVKPRT